MLLHPVRYVEQRLSNWIPQIARLLSSCPANFLCMNENLQSRARERAVTIFFTPSEGAVCRVRSLTRIVERERDHTIARNRVIKKTAARSRNHDVLLPVGALVRDRRGFRRAGQFHGPQLLPGLRIECAEARVIGSPHKDEPAGRCDRATVARPARISLSFRQTVGDAQTHFPGDLARIDIYCREFSPRRLLTW